MKNSKSLLLQLPIWILLSYLCFSLLLFQIGPFKWQNPNPVAFWILQVAYLSAVFVGWQIGIRKSKAAFEWNTEKEKGILKLLSVLLIVYAVVETINLFRMFGFDSFDFPALIKRVAWGIKNPGESYRDYQNIITVTDGSQILGGRIMTVVNYVWQLIAYTVLLLSTYYFRRLNIVSKVFLVINYFLIAVNYLSIGTNIGLFRLVVGVLVFVMLWFLNAFTMMDKKKKRRVLCILVAVVLVAIVGLTVFFDMVMKERGGILNWQKSDYNVGGYGLNKESVVFKILPESMYMTAISASSYLTQGYQGMALALSVDWKPMFGVGHNMRLMKIMRKVGIDVMPNTYQTRIMEEYNWDSEIRWHSMYTWWANDFSFVGTIAIMFLIGLLFALAYKDCIETKNPFARLMVFYFALLAFFIPCNNQLFQSSVVMLSFYTTFVVWLYTRGTLKKEWILKCVNGVKSLVGKKQK